MAHQKRPGQIDVDHAAPPVDRRIAHIVPEADARRVDESIEPAKRSSGRGDRSFDLAFVRDITPKEHAAGCLRDRSAAHFVHIEDCDPRALAREQFCRGAADARSAARDQNAPSRQRRTHQRTPLALKK